MIHNSVLTELHLYKSDLDTSRLRSVLSAEAAYVAAQLEGERWQITFDAGNGDFTTMVGYVYLSPEGFDIYHDAPMTERTGISYWSDLNSGPISFVRQDTP